MRFVFVRAEHPGRNIIGDDEIAALAREFFPRVAQQIARFGGCVVEGLTDIGLNYINFFTGQSKDLTQTVEQISDAGQQVVYDHFVGASLLGTARLIFLTGISVSPDTLQAIAKRVREGATCVALRSLAWTLVPETSAGGTTTSPSGQGKWVITDDFADPAVRAQVEPFLGNPQEIRYQFGKHELRLRAMDGDPNRIRVEV